MDSERQIAPPPPIVGGTSRFAVPVLLTGLQPLQRLTVLLAVALIVYLPLEPSLIGGLPGAWYWVARLMPDGLVALLALAVVLFGDRRARTVPIRLLWIIGAVAGILVVANAARGFSVVDSINAIRVDTRYLVLGLLVWWAVDGTDGSGPIILAAVFVAGGLEIAAGAFQILLRIPAVLSGSAAAAPSSFFFLSGTVGRYDRFGLSMMSVVIAIVATGEPLRRRAIALLAVCLFLLYLSTARQAMVGLFLAGLLLVILPATVARRRMLGGALAVLGVALILATPSVIPAPPASSDPDATGSVEGVQLEKGSIEVSAAPTRNFRLFYNLDVLPWAAATRPLLGFGPGQQVAAHPDPVLQSYVEKAGIRWDWARRFMNDSNYASLVIQFGLIAPVLFVLFAASLLGIVGRAALRRADGFARFAFVFGVAVLAAAWFGPAFEIRTVSIIFWVALMTAIAGLQRSNAGA